MTAATLYYNNSSSSLKQPNMASPPLLRGPGASSSSTTLPPQTNGTHKTQAESKSVETEGLLEEMRSALSSPVLDSPNSSADITLDTTGDLTVEDVKDFLTTVDEAENNFRNITEEDGRPPGILIN